MGRDARGDVTVIWGDKALGVCFERGNSGRRGDRVYLKTSSTRTFLVDTFVLVIALHTEYCNESSTSE